MLAAVFPPHLQQTADYTQFLVLRATSLTTLGSATLTSLFGVRFLFVAV